MRDDGAFGTAEFWSAMDAAGYGNYRENRTAAEAAVDQRSAGLRLADRQFADIVQFRLAVSISGIPTVTAKVLAELDDYRRDSCGDRELSVITEASKILDTGTDELPASAMPVGVGVVAALWPGQLYEISPRLGLAEILDEELGLAQPNGTASQCEMPGSLRAPACVRRARRRRVSAAVTFALAYQRPKRLIIAWRCCQDCRDGALARNRDRRVMAANSPLNAQYASTE